MSDAVETFGTKNKGGVDWTPPNSKALLLAHTNRRHDSLARNAVDPVPHTRVFDLESVDFEVIC